MRTVDLIPHSRPWINKADLEAVQSVLERGMIAKGEKVDQLESEVCEFLGINHAVAQSRGTAALVIALRKLAVGKYDEVIVPTYVCKNVLEAVLTVGQNLSYVTSMKTGLLLRQ